MGWLARVMVPSVAVVLVGCAAIANLGDAQPADEQNSSGTSGTGTSGTGTSGTGTSGTGTSGTGTSGAPAEGGTSGGSSGDSGGTTMEAGMDAAPLCMAPKVANGQSCNAAADCCSNACVRNHKCNDQCTKPGDGCNVLKSDECCIGSYCSLNALSKCAGCRANGTNAEVDVGNVLVTSSCCSGNADPMTTKCIP